MSKQKKLYLQLKAIKKTIEKIVNDFDNVEEIQDDATISYQTSMISKIEVVKNKMNSYKKIEDQLMDEMNEESELEELLKGGMTFEIMVNEKIITLNQKFRNNEKKPTPKEENMASTKEFENKIRKPTVKLPPIEIKKFNDDATKWQGFIESLEVAVDKNIHLSDIEKFNYLRSYLSGNALHAIDGFSLSSANYEKAMLLLKERYGNTQVIITSHMNELLKIPKVRTDGEIRQCYDNIEAHVRSLKSL